MKRDKRYLPQGPDAPHYPNKEEGKALRRLMATSGDTKDVVLADKGNRRIIAAAKKSCGMGDREHREAYLIQMIKRRIAKLLNLPSYAPAVLKRFNEEYEVGWGMIRRRHPFGRMEVRG